MKKIHRAPILRRSFSLMLTLAMLAGMIVLSSVQGQATLDREPTPLPDVTFVVPESVYLRGRAEGAATYVDWYVNNDPKGKPVDVVPGTATASGASTSPQKSPDNGRAAVYAVVPGAKNLSLTLDLLNGCTPHTFKDIPATNAGNDWAKLDLNGIDELEFTAGEQNTSTLMKWTLTVTVDPKDFGGFDTFSYTNYSVVYSPLYVPSAYILDANITDTGFQSIATLNGLHKNFQTTQKLHDDPAASPDPDAPRMLPLADVIDYPVTIQPGMGTGDNVYSPDTAQQYRTIEPGSAIYVRLFANVANTARNAWVGQTADVTGNVAAAYANFHDRALSGVTGTTTPTHLIAADSNAVRITGTTGDYTWLGGNAATRGELHVDISRYTQFGKIPNLFIHTFRFNRRFSAAWKAADTGVFTSTAAPVNNTTASNSNHNGTGLSGSTKRGGRGLGDNFNNEDSMFASGFGDYAVGTLTTLNCGAKEWAGTGSNDRGPDIYMPFTFTVTRSDKSALRASVFDSVGALPDELRVPEYDAALQAVCEMLGSPFMDANNTLATALLALKDERISPPFATGEAVINHISNATGETLATETRIYGYGDIVTASAFDAVVADTITGTPGVAGYYELTGDTDFGVYSYERHVDADDVTSKTGSATIDVADEESYSWDFYYDPIFTLEYDENEGTGAIPPTDVVFNGTTAPANPNLFERTGYTAVGWHTSADAAVGDAVNTLAEIQDLVGDINGGDTFTLYAIWDVNTFITASFDLRGGKGYAPEPKTVLIGTEYGDLPPDPSRSGYTFFGWYTEPDGAGEKITADSVVTLIDNHTLYARWEITSNTKFVTGVTGLPNPEKSVLIVGEAYGPLPILDRPGYTFLGWFTADGTEITETSIVPGEDQTLYAKWSDTQTGTVTFDPNGGKKPSPAKMGVTFGTQYGALPPVTRKGYDFNGWYTDDGVKITATSIVSKSGNHTLTARWTAQTAVVTFDSRGGTSAGKKTVTFDEKYGALPTVKRTGFTFNGWYTRSVGGKKITAKDLVAVAGDHTLFAQWTAKGGAPLQPPVLVVDVDTLQIRYRSRLAIFPNVIRGQNLEWSSDSDFVTVDQNGNIESVKKLNAYQKGSTAIITAKNDAGSVSITVVVQPTIWQIIVTFLAFGWLWY